MEIKIKEQAVETACVSVNLIKRFDQLRTTGHHMRSHKIGLLVFIFFGLVTKTIDNVMKSFVDEFALFDYSFLW
jgi:hypothetical protein